MTAVVPNNKLCTFFFLQSQHPVYTLRVQVDGGGVVLDAVVRGGQLIVIQDSQAMFRIRNLMELLVDGHKVDDADARAGAWTCAFASSLAAEMFYDLLLAAGLSSLAA